LIGLLILYAYINVPSGCIGIQFCIIVYGLLMTVVYSIQVAQMEETN